MFDPGTRLHWQPTAAQDLLLRAALLRSEHAIAAWVAWQRAIGAAPGSAEVALDAGSERLLPLVAHNLERLGVPSDALLARGREARLRGRFKGVLRMRDAGTWAAELAARGVPALVLKGLALVLRYYDKDFGLRPMEDVDLLVRPEHVPAVLEYLHAERFEPTETIPATCWPPRPVNPRPLNLADAAVTHGCGFLARAPAGYRPTPIDNGERQLDIHWAALSTHCAPGADDRLWAAAERLPLSGAEAHALSPPHELVHILAHGIRWNEVPTIRWITDAAAVIATMGARLDWDAFVAEVGARGLGLGVAPALEVLTRFAIAVPDEVIARVRALPVRLVDRLRLEHSAWPWDRKKPLRVIAFDAWRFCEGLGPAATLRQLARYASSRLAPDGRLGSVPGQLGAKLGRRAR